MTNWYDKYLAIYGKLPEEKPDLVWNEIKSKLAERQSQDPVASVVVIAYNEEQLLAYSLWLLSKIQGKGIARAFYRKDHYENSEDNLVKSKFE